MPGTGSQKGVKVVYKETKGMPDRFVATAIVNAPSMLPFPSLAVPRDPRHPSSPAQCPRPPGPLRVANRYAYVCSHSPKDL